MTIERLLKAVPPPAAPREGYAGRWEPIETFLGTALPQDYKDFARLYGSGDFMEFLGIHTPRCSSPYMRLESEAYAVADLFRMLEEFSYPIWPEAGGLLACGKTNDGGYLFWRTHGRPADWSVVFWDRGLGEFEAFDCGLTDFLAGLASGEILLSGFPEDPPPCDRLFAPYSDRHPRSFKLAWQISYGGSH